VLNGYAYLSPVGVTDPAEVARRVPLFMERAGHYFANWDDLYARWMDKIKALIQEMEQLSFKPLPEMEELDVVTSGRGSGSGLELLESYHKLLDLALRLWQYHFEFLNLGYAAYLDYFGFCKQAFPSIPDLAIAKMVAGVEVDLFRPNEELKNLARAAVELGVDDQIAQGDPAKVLDRLSQSEAGRAWLEKWEAVKQPWFNFSAGGGFYHSDAIWIENLEVPFGFLRSYINKVKAGENIERPIEAVRAERDRIVKEYTELLATDEDRATFEAKLGLARVVFPYVENHNFYVEHWGHSVLWRKMRDLGSVLAQSGFFQDRNDVFLLKRDEVPEAIWDMYSAWAVGVEPRGPKYWPQEIARRQGIIDVLAKWSPPKALGQPPEVVTEPFTIMLWGITSESVAMWLGAGDGESAAGELRGFAASPGVAEGPARVIFTADEIGTVQPGEILVAPITAPAWAPIFGTIKATVTDIGGMMSHAAIVCREYGLPAVTGTAFGTRDIKTGQRIRVDGSNGTVTMID
jgi:pyruvate,water dikinase